MSNVQALETIRKLNEIKRCVKNALDTLPGIRTGLVRFRLQLAGLEVL